MIAKLPVMGAFLTAFLFVMTVPELATATPPTPPWRAWERIARVDGAAAVRDHYRQAINETQRRLRRLPDDASEDVFSERLILTGTMIDYLDSWSLVESRERHAGSEGRSTLADTVWPQLISYTSAALRFRDELTRRAGVLRATRAAAEPRWSGRLADNIHKNVDHLAWRLALLGRIANDTNRVRQVFTLFGGRIGTHASAESFIADEQDIPRLIQVAPEVTEPSAALAVPVDPARRESARTFISRFFAAVREPNDPSLIEFIADLDHPVSLSAQTLRAKLAGADITAARYRFATLDGGEFVARVEGVITTRGQGRGRSVHVRNLAFRFRTMDNRLKLLSIGGL